MSAVSARLGKHLMRAAEHIGILTFESFWFQVPGFERSVEDSIAFVVSADQR